VRKGRGVDPKVEEYDTEIRLDHGTRDGKPHRACCEPLPRQSSCPGHLHALLRAFSVCIGATTAFRLPMPDEVVVNSLHFGEPAWTNASLRRRRHEKIPRTAATILMGGYSAVRHPGESHRRCPPQRRERPQHRQQNAGVRRLRHWRDDPQRQGQKMISTYVGGKQNFSSSLSSLSGNFSRTKSTGHESERHPRRCAGNSRVLYATGYGTMVAGRKRNFANLTAACYVMSAGLRGDLRLQGGVWKRGPLGQSQLHAKPAATSTHDGTARITSSPEVKNLSNSAQIDPHQVHTPGISSMPFQGPKIREAHRAPDAAEGVCVAVFRR